MELLPDAQQWKEILVPAASWGEKIFRPLLVYLSLLILLRMSGKRAMGQLTLFDFVILLLISETAQNALVGEDFSVTGGLIAAALLVGFSVLLDRLTFRSDKVRMTIEGSPTLLIYEGQILDKTLNKETLSRDELLTALRKQGIARLTEVRFAILEVGGEISVIRADAPRPETNEQDSVTPDIKEQLPLLATRK